MSKKEKCCVSGECLNAIAIAFANTIAKNLTAAQISLLSLLFTVIGDALGLISQTRNLCESQDSDEITVNVEKRQTK